jgi:hypothetical protein
MHYLPQSVTQKIARTILETQKSSPKLLFVTGIIGFGVTVVLASRATLKADEFLEDAQKDKVQLETLNHPQYTELDRQKDMTLFYMKSCAQLMKLYAPTVIVGTLTILSLTKSHNILAQRNAALTAAYVAIQKSFDAYRERVRAELGDDKDREFKHGVEMVEIKNEKNGKVKQVKRAGEVDPETYTRIFDQLCPDWSPYPDNNRTFLQCQEKYMNDLLQLNGHVFLNEVYDRLGIPRSMAGSVVGWIFDPDNPNIDNYIDFGAFDSNQNMIDFMNGRSKGVWLDFNVDGPINHLIEDLAKEKHKMNRLLTRKKKEK